MTYRYSIFGLTIDSCLELPELIPGDGVPDIHICWGDVPIALEGARKTTNRFQAKPGCLLFTAERVARLLVSNGNRVLVEKLPGAEEDLVRMFILGSALGAILHQRELLPLHASCIKTGNGCVMFCGRPGTGKSTLARIFIQRGYELHADDICVIGVDNEDTPFVYPTYPQMKLWEDTIEKMGDKTNTYRPMPSCSEKFAVPTYHFSREPLPVRMIYILNPHDKDHIEITPVTGVNKYKALRFQTYRRRFLEGLGTTASHFHAETCVGKQVPMYRLNRPKSQFLLNELGDILEKHLMGGE